MVDWETPIAVHSKCGESAPLLATNAIDGDITTSWAYYVYLYHWIIFDMGETKNITKIKLFQSSHKYYRWGFSDGFKVYVSDDPEDFGDPVWEGVLDAAGWQESGWFSKKGRYIKLLSKCRSIAQETIYEFAYTEAPPPLGEEPIPSEKGRLNVYAVADSEDVAASFLVNKQGPYGTPYGLNLDIGTYTLIGSYKGQTDKKSVEIKEGETKTVTLTFAKMHKLTVVSDPSPIDFTFEGQAQKTPFVRELVSGTYTLVMPASHMIGLDEYDFEQWENDSKKTTRTITLASPQEVILTATYRLRQIDEAGPINQRQAKDVLQEVVGQGADLSPTNPLPTEDSGKHSNPEKFVQDNKFSSWPIDRVGAAATLLYGVGSPAAHRRTAGLDITVWWIYFYNHSGGQATVWLESPLGTVISGTVQLADNQGVMLNVKPLDVGDEDIFVNASANNVMAQIGGVET